MSESLYPLEESRRRFRRCLVAFPSSIGNTVQALPFLNTLRRGLPEAQVAIVAKPSAAPLLVGHPAVDRVLPWGGRSRGFWALGRVLRRERPDLALDLGGVLKTALVSRLSGARLRLGYAYAECRDLVWLTGHRPIAPVGHLSNVERYLAFARALGVAEIDRSSGLAPAREDLARARALLAGRGVAEGAPLAVLIADASNWKKAWEPRRFEALARRLAEGGLVPAVVSHRPLEPFGAGAPGRVDLVGAADLRALMGLFAQAAVVVGADTGPVHVAAALGRPTVTIFGPTRVGRYRPYGPRVEVVRRNHDLACVGCSRREPCVHPHHHACLDRVQVEEVAEAALRLAAGGVLPSPARRETPATRAVS